MADNYLENHYEEYQRRKAEWLKKKKKRVVKSKPYKQLERPEDEAL